MKTYPTIDYFGEHWGLPIIAFDKLDGSNLRFEYSQKRGFYKFGSRNVMFDETNEQFGFAIELFKNKYADKLTEIFKTKNYRSTQSFVCFGELVGTKSAFGQHDFEDDEFDIKLFDIAQYKKGFIQPKQFVNDFQELGIPKIIYEGNLNKEFVQQVKKNDFNLSEGVICKGIVKTKKGIDNIYACKIKTDDWFMRLKDKHPYQFEAELKQATKQNE
jgi:hypothetical protein